MTRRCRNRCADFRPWMRGLRCQKRVGHYGQHSAKTSFYSAPICWGEP